MTPSRTYPGKQEEVITTRPPGNQSTADQVGTSGRVTWAGQRRRPTAARAERPIGGRVLRWKEEVWLGEAKGFGSSGGGGSQDAKAGRARGPGGEEHTRSGHGSG
jgi:hypothetical protein